MPAGTFLGVRPLSRMSWLVLLHGVWAVMPCSACIASSGSSTTTGTGWNTGDHLSCTVVPWLGDVTVLLQALVMSLDPFFSISSSSFLHLLWNFCFWALIFLICSSCFVTCRFNFETAFATRFFFIFWVVDFGPVPTSATCFFLFFRGDFEVASAAACLFLLLGNFTVSVPESRQINKCMNKRKKVCPESCFKV